VPHTSHTIRHAILLNLMTQIIFKVKPLLVMENMNSFVNVYALYIACVCRPSFVIISPII
jgi:hypothetical protein